jgi:hypothetical protein
LLTEITKELETLLIVSFHLNGDGMRKLKVGNQDRLEKEKLGVYIIIHPTIGEKYYLRMLLLTVKGASRYESLEPRATFYITHSKKHAKHEAFSVMIKNYLIQAAIWALLINCDNSL